MEDIRWDGSHPLTTVRRADGPQENTILALNF